MPLDTALDRAVALLVQSNPFVLAARSGCIYDGGTFRVPFFNQTYLLSFPQGEGGALSPWLRLLLLHYILTADGTAVEEQWISYRHLPGAELFECRFHNLALHSLAQAFARDLAGFSRAGQALGGIAMRLGDASFRFNAFPRLPLVCIIYQGDEEVAGSANILFDVSAPHYLATEDLAYLGEYLVDTLRRLKG